MRRTARTAAERTGFEPADQCDPVTGLANRRFRPLSHLSETLMVQGFISIISHGFCVCRTTAYTTFSEISCHKRVCKVALPVVWPGEATKNPLSKVTQCPILPQKGVLEKPPRTAPPNLTRISRSARTLSGAWQKTINRKIHYFGRWGRRVNGKLERLPERVEP